MNKPIIIIAGPTASGKTSLAVELAKKLNGEVVNADSRTVYRGMDIATAKPTEAEKQGIPHHLFDLVDPADVFSVSDYKKLADEKIKEIHTMGKVPILVGGTGLYLDSVVYDFGLTNAVPDSAARKELNKKSQADLFERLRKIDPVSASKIDPNNKRRLIRALEVTIQTGVPFSEQQIRKNLPDNILYLAIDVPRDELYQRINDRVEGWLSSGLLEETKKLRENYDSNIPSMSAIGYKEVGEFLDGKVTQEAAIEEMKKRTRNYAKRQLTWFRRNKDIIWVKDLNQAQAAFEQKFKTI